MQDMKNTLLDEWDPWEEARCVDHAVAGLGGANRTETVDGAIKIFAKGKHVRTEYAPGHTHHGTIELYKDGNHVVSFRCATCRPRPARNDSRRALESECR